jgi:hypothetical protein
MPELQDFWSEVSKTRKDIVFLCVNIGDKKSVINEWWEKDGFTLTPVRQDGDAVSSAFQVEYYPTNYIVGPQGKILYRKVGYEEDEIRSILGLEEF